MTNPKEKEVRKKLKTFLLFNHISTAQISLAHEELIISHILSELSRVEKETENRVWREASEVAKKSDDYVCKQCGGDGRECIGENKVSLDMAIDAGDRSMEGMHHSYEFATCPNCGGTGVNNTLDSISYTLLSQVKQDE